MQRENDVFEVSKSRLDLYQKKKSRLENQQLRKNRLLSEAWNSMSDCQRLERMGVMKAEFAEKEKTDVRDLDFSVVVSKGRENHRPMKGGFAEISWFM